MLKEFIKDEEGQSIVEYSLLMTLIGASMVFLMTMMGISISKVMGITTVTIDNVTVWTFEKFKTR